jgi:hypothetical protein
MTDDTTRQAEQPPEGGATTPPAVEGSEISETTPPGGGELGAPVVTPASAGAGGSRARWAIGLGIAGVALGAIVAAIIVFGSRPTPPALTYIPGNAAMVVEVRPDLPGDQLQKLGNLLAHFPGFADQSTLPEKLDESFAQLFSKSGDGSIDYRADIKPWLSGPAYIALLPPGDGAANNPMAFMRGVASLTTTGSVSCDTPFRGQTVTHESYQSLDLVLSEGAAAACVVNGPQALLGDPASVKAALDAHAAGSSIDRTTTYQKARASLKGDQLAAVYISGAAYIDLVEDMAALTPGMSEMLPSLQQAFPEWAMEGLRAEDDALVLEVTGGPLPVASAPIGGGSPGATPGGTLRPVPPAHPSVILPFAPANTILYYEGQGTGAALLNSIDQLRQFPMYATMLDQLDSEADLDEVLAWIADAGVIVANGQNGPGGGLVLVAPDAGKATERAATLKGLVALAQLGGLDIDSADSDVNGAKVTTYTVRNLGGMLPPGSLGPGVELPADGTFSFSIATKDRTILIGAGGSFVTDALSVQPGSGLADQASYKAAMARSVPNSQMTMYVAIRDIVTLVEPMIPAEERAQWESALKPYFAPFQAFSLTVAGDPATGSHGKFIVTITNP